MRASYDYVDDFRSGDANYAAGLSYAMSVLRVNNLYSRNGAYIDCEVFYSVGYGGSALNSYRRDVIDRDLVNLRCGIRGITLVTHGYDVIN